MLKKCFAAVLISLCLFSTADARPYSRHHTISHHLPPVIVKHSHTPVGSILAAGIAGTVIGSVIASNQSNISYGQSSRCVVLRSRYDGHIIRRCYTEPVCSNCCRDDVYDILYID